MHMFFRGNHGQSVPAWHSRSQGLWGWHPRSVWMHGVRAISSTSFNIQFLFRKFWAAYATSEVGEWLQRPPQKDNVKGLAAEGSRTLPILARQYCLRKLEITGLRKRPLSVRGCLAFPVVWYFFFFQNSRDFLIFWQPRYSQLLQSV